MKRSNIWLMVAVLIFVLSACGRASGVASTGLRQAREHWSAAVNLENQMEGQYRQIMTEVSTGYSTLGLNNQLADDCFVNSQEVIQAAMEGRYGTAAEDGDRPDGGFDQQAFINAFAVNESYPGDVKQCQEMVSDLADDVRIWNQDKADNFGAFWDMVREYDDHIHDDVVKSLAVDFAQMLEEKADEAGIDIPDYVYPTFNLTVETRDREICDYYAQSGECDWNPALKNGTLSGQAAYEYMTRLFVAPEVSAAFDEGEDNLNPFENSPR